MDTKFETKHKRRSMPTKQHDEKSRSAPATINHQRLFNADIMHLQRTLGNQYVIQLLREKAALEAPANGIVSSRTQAGQPNHIQRVTDITLKKFNLKRKLEDQEAADLAKVIPENIPDADVEKFMGLLGKYDVDQLIALAPRLANINASIEEIVSFLSADDLIELKVIPSDNFNGHSQDHLGVRENFELDIETNNKLPKDQALALLGNIRVEIGQMPIPLKTVIGAPDEDKELKMSIQSNSDPFAGKVLATASRKIIAPSEGSVKLRSETYGKDPNKVGFIGDLYVKTPAKVSLQGLEFSEGECDSDFGGTPTQDFMRLNPKHVPGKPAKIYGGDASAGDGAHVDTDDDISSGMVEGGLLSKLKPFTMTWRIPWNYTKKDGKAKEFVKIEHKLELKDDGTLTLTKGEASVSKGGFKVKGKSKK